MEDTKSEKFYNKWGWHLIVYNLTGGDIIKTENVYSKNLMEVLNWLSLVKEKEMYDK